MVVGGGVGRRFFVVIARCVICLAVFTVFIYPVLKLACMGYTSVLPYALGLGFFLLLFSWGVALILTEALRKGSEGKRDE